MKPTEQLLRDALEAADEDLTNWIRGKADNETLTLLREVVREALAATSQQAEGEPVAWAVDGERSYQITVYTKETADYWSAQPGYAVRPLYAAPLPAQPQGQGAEPAYYVAKSKIVPTSKPILFSADEKHMADELVAHAHTIIPLYTAPPSQAPEPAQQEAAEPTVEQMTAWLESDEGKAAMAASQARSKAATDALNEARKVTAADLSEPYFAHAAPQAAAPSGWDAEFLSKRLSRVAKLAGVPMPDMTHEQIAEVAGTILGQIATALARTAPVVAEDADYELHQGDMMVAAASGPGAWREIQNYAAQYQQDGPVEIYEVTRRKIAAQGEGT